MSSNNSHSYRRRTKIVATVGPASRSPETIKRLIEAGVDVFRLNFSHGSHEEHLEVLKNIRSISEELETPVAVLQDLAGPKIRITKVIGDFGMIPDGGKISIVCGKDLKGDDALSTTSRLVTETVNPSEFVKPGHQILLADGLLELKVDEIKGEETVCTIVKGGRIRSRVGIAFPDSRVSLPATTAKDLDDFSWGVRNEVDYVAISFVQNADDLLTLRSILAQAKSDLKLIAKIERPVAMENIEEIVNVSDGLMVARGDLGLELPLERVPGIQKRLIDMANDKGIPVIVATQMLQSMVTSLRPTRAEVTDVAYAVVSGTDAVMLSEETAIGEHPVECVKYLGRIAVEAERTNHDHSAPKMRQADKVPVADAVAYAACAAASKINSSAVIACTATGTSARLLSKYRPEQPVFGVSSIPSTLRRMCLYWGVKPLFVPAASDHDSELEAALATVKEKFNFSSGEKAVITGGRVVMNPGATNKLEVRNFT